MQFQFRILLLLTVVAVLSCSDDCPCPVKYEEPGDLRYSLGILRVSWTIASPPIDENLFTTLPARGSFDPALNWFNPYDQFMNSDIYDGFQGDDRMHVLVVRFDPKNSKLFDSTLQNQRDVWAGIMNGLPRGVWNQSRAEYLEFRMAAVSVNDDGSFGTPDNLGVLHVDLGRISEDVNLDGLSNTEDVNRNGILEDSEDIGLDGIPDDMEDLDGDGMPDTVFATLPDGAVINDPAGDDWYFNPDYRDDIDRINGTEGNANDLLLGRPDREDIGGERENDLDNAYYSFVIDLSDPGDFVVAGSEKASQQLPPLTWRTYRIPLWTNYTPIDFNGLPDSTSIHYARLWIDNAPQRMDVYIAAQDFVMPPPGIPETE